MFNSLFSASIDRKDSIYLDKFPRFILTDKERELLDWLSEYHHNYGELPNRERIDETDWSIYLTDHMVKSPLSDLYEMSLSAKRESYALKKFKDLQLDIDSGKMPTKSIIDLGFQLSALTESDTIFLSDFDRDELYSENEPEGIKFGFETIDEQTGGLLNGEFAVLSGRPESGKTLLSNFIAWNVITDYNNEKKKSTYEHCKKVLYISAEMTPHKIITRMDAIAGGFNTKILRQKKDKNALKEAKDSASTAWRYVNSKGGELIIPKLGIISPENVLDEINKHNPDFVVCDAMYRFKNLNSNSNDWRSDAEIVRSIANIARVTNKPILGTSQITRQGVKGQYDLNDLAFSDAYSQEPDIVLGIYNMPSHPNAIIISPMKVRDGNKNGLTEIKVNFGNSTYTEKEYEDLESMA